MSRAPTTTLGPLGSTIHSLHAGPDTVAALAAVGWSRHFRRVCLDPVRGLVTLMAPSRLHDDLAGIFTDIVDIATGAFGRPSRGLLTTRLRGPGDPPGTGMEPDCAFYVGDRARGYRAALIEGEAQADAFLECTAPDLVVEVELTNADDGKIERYGDIGVRELWRVHARRGTREVGAGFLALRPGAPPRPLASSEVIGGLEPADVCEAVEGVRRGLSREDRTEAVARIVRRRKREIFRVREETPGEGGGAAEAKPGAPSTDAGAGREHRAPAARAGRAGGGPGGPRPYSAARAGPPGRSA